MKRRVAGFVAASTTAIALMAGCGESAPQLPTLDGPAHAEIVDAQDTTKIPAAVGRAALSVVRVDTLDDSGTGVVVYYGGMKVILTAAHVAFNASRCADYPGIHYQPVAAGEPAVVSRVRAQTNVTSVGGLIAPYDLSFNNGTDLTEVIPETVPAGIPAVPLPKDIFDAFYQRPGDPAFFETYDYSRDPATQHPTYVGGTILGSQGSNMLVAVPVGSVIHTNSGSPMFGADGAYEGDLVALAKNGADVSSSTILSTYDVRMPPTVTHSELVWEQSYLQGDLNPANNQVPQLISCGK